VHAAGSQFVRDFGKTVMGAARDYLRTQRQALIASARRVESKPAKPTYRNGARRSDLQQN
jgi:hypothetical protein